MGVKLCEFTFIEELLSAAQSTNEGSHELKAD